MTFHPRLGELQFSRTHRSDLPVRQMVRDTHSGGGYGENPTLASAGQVRCTCEALWHAATSLNVYDWLGGTEPSIGNAAPYVSGRASGLAFQRDCRAAQPSDGFPPCATV